MEEQSLTKHSVSSTFFFLLSFNFCSQTVGFFILPNLKLSDSPDIIWACFFVSHSFLEILFLEIHIDKLRKKGKTNKTENLKAGHE